MKPVVRSLLETDLYKFTMWQALLHSHPDAVGEYEFLCRNQPAYPLAELMVEVERELDHLCALMFRDHEVAYLRGLRFIKSDFADFLTLFRFQRKFIQVETDGPHLRIRASGPLGLPRSRTMSWPRRRNSELARNGTLFHADR